MKVILSLLIFNAGAICLWWGRINVWLKILEIFWSLARNDANDCAVSLEYWDRNDWGNLILMTMRSKFRSRVFFLNETFRATNARVSVCVIWSHRLKMCLIKRDTSIGLAASEFIVETILWSFDLRVCVYVWQGSVLAGGLSACIWHCVQPMQWECDARCFHFDEIFIKFYALNRLGFSFSVSLSHPLSERWNAKI